METVLKCVQLKYLRTWKFREPVCPISNLTMRRNTIILFFKSETFFYKNY